MSAAIALAVAMAAGRIALRFSHPPELAMAALLLAIGLAATLIERHP